MNYLTGPLTRVQIPALNQLAGASLGAAAPAHPPGMQETLRPAPAPAGAPAPAAASTPAEPELEGSETRPMVPAGVAEYFLPHNLTLSQAARAEGRELPADAVPQGVLYRPALLAQAEIRFFQRKYNLDHELRRSALVLEPDRRGAVRWDEFLVRPVDPRSLERTPAPQARFAPLDAPLSDARSLKSLERDFADWGYRATEAIVRANEALKVFAGPEVSPAEFRELCAEAARAARDKEVEKVSTSFEKKIDALEKKLAREERELSEDEAELSQRKMEEMGTHLENVAGLFGLGRKRRMTTSLSKRRMTAQAKADVEESEEAIEEFKEEIEELEAEARQVLEEINDRWGEVANEVAEIKVTPYKKDVLVEVFGVAWLPHLLVEAGGRVLELPGFGEAE
jgi:hypothetical protein